MTTQLRAIVVGAGWAGEGHTRALQWCNVEVVGICSRQQDVVRAVADRLGVAEASTDWRTTIERRRPDIVTLATPAILRREVLEVVAAHGCHVLCEKPLALDAADAEASYLLVQAAGVKHAYAATQCYGAEVAWLAELVRDRTIGALRAIVGTFHGGRPGQQGGVSPWSWMADWRSGGGRLNNGLPHDLAILSTIIGGKPLRAMGRVETVRRELPVLPGLHDIRQMREVARTLTPERAQQLEQRPAEMEGGAAVLLEFAGPDGPLPVTMSAGSGRPIPGDIDGWRLYADEGTLLARRANGRFSYTISVLRNDHEEPLPVPQRLLDAVPSVGDDEQNKWCALVRDFVASIRGEPHRPYLTLHDGWRDQVIIDAIRTGRGWTALPR
jgi:predicted dehydrogenase